MKTYLYSGIRTRFQFFLLLLVIAFFACEKEQEDNEETEISLVSYAQLNLADIKAKEATFSNAGLIISDANGIYFKSGDVLLFKTSQGYYGKMEIISINQVENYLMTIKAVTYNTDGTVCQECSSSAIRGTWLFDLDAMAEVDAISNVEDFWNQRINATDTQLTPKNNATFVRYTIK
jgi:hypothetical protein